MHKIFTCLFFVLIAIGIRAQNKKVDSLLTALDAATADTTKVKILHSIAEMYMDNNPNKAIDYLQKAVESAKRSESKLQVANNYYSIGYTYRQKGNYDSSLDYYLRSVRIYEELKDDHRLANALMSIANIYGENDDFKKTNEYFDRCEALIRRSKDSIQLADLMSERGVLYDRKKIYDTALIYLLKGKEIGTALKQDDYIIRSLSNIGLTYKHLHNTKEALRCFDSVLVFFRKNGALADEFAGLFNNIAATYSQDGNYAKARSFFDSSINYANTAGIPYINMENYRNLSDMYKEMKNYQLQADYQNRYYNIKDSLFNVDNKNLLTQLEADYHIEQKNGVIVKQKAEVEHQKNQRNIFIIVALTAALILVILAFVYSRISKKNKQLEEQNIKSNAQKNELQMLNHVKDRLFSIISHDLRNPLITLRSYLFLADNKDLNEEKKKAFKNETLDAVTQTSDMLDNLLTWANMQIKETKAAITPIDIDDCVTNAINNVQAQAQQKQITISRQIDISNALADEHILNIALRNILTNAIKYSAPGKSIFISTQKRGDDILLAIKD